MSKDLVLAIDNGTQSVRALLFDLRGNLLAKSRVPLDPYTSPKPGWAEQAPEVFWQAVCQACQELWQMPGVEKERIAGIALTTQRSTIICMGKDDKPLRPAIVWPDQRRTTGLKPIGGLWGLGFRLTGMSRTSAYLQEQAEASWLRKHEPQTWEKIHKYLFLSGYLTFRLTGKYVDSVGAQVGYIPFDYKRRTWSKDWDWKWQVAPLERCQLPDLVPPAQMLGEISSEAAEATGLPVGLPLIAAAADKACEVIGLGGLEPNIGCLSFGTAATINTTHKKYVEVIPLIPPYPSAVPDAYSLEIQIFRGYWMVSWFKQEFGQSEVEQSSESGVSVEDLFDESVREVPPGSQGLILQPYWSPGLKVPGPEAKGAVIGFADVHTRAHLYRAILEGLAYALRDGAERIERRSGVRITELRVAGGGSQSDVAMQVTADVFGLPTTRPHVYEASGLGAAIDAAVGVGLHPDFSTAIKEMTHPGKTFQPDPAAHKVYDHLYRKVYLRLYDRLKPLYEEFGEIPGMV